MKSLAALTLGLLLAGCTSGHSSNPENSSGPRPGDVAPHDVAKDQVAKDQAAPDQTKAETNTDATNSPCPWNIAADPVAKKYADAGIQITIDCSMVNTSFQLNRTDVDSPLKVLDENFNLFDGWKNRPNTIRIGGGPFHDSKNKIIQVPVRMGLRDGDLKNYLESIKKLMDFEAEVFNNEVRVSYLNYHLAKRPDGSMVDVGAGIIYSEDPETLDNSLATLKKYKSEVLAHRKQYPNVVLYWGNEMGQFRINNWDMSYEFAPAVSAEDQIGFFKYLTKYEELRTAYAPVDIALLVSGYPKADFAGYNKMLSVATHIRDQVLALNPQPRRLVFDREVVPQIGATLSFTYMNSTLTVDNLMDYSGEVAKADEVKSCLARADFSKSVRFKCSTPE